MTDRFRVRPRQHADRARGRGSDAVLLTGSIDDGDAWLTCQRLGVSGIDRGQLDVGLFRLGFS